MTESGAIYGIVGRMRGRVQTAPQLRFANNGAELIEFKVKLAEDWPPEGPLAEELVVVRFGGQHPELARWLAPHRHVVCEGSFHLARWSGKHDGVARAQLVLEARTVEPLDDERPNPSRAAAYASRPAHPNAGPPPTQEQRLDHLEALLGGDAA